MSIKLYLQLKTSLLALLFLIAAAGCSRIQESPRAVRGFMDFSVYDLEHHGPAALKGEWYFIPNAFLTHNEMEKEIRNSPHFVPVPAIINKQVVDGVSIPIDGFGTYALRIKLSDRQYSGKQELALKLECINTAFRLFIDGREEAAGGRPGKDRDSIVPAYRPMVVDFMPQSDTVMLVFHVANFHHRKWGLLNNLYIGTEDSIRALYDRYVYTDLFLLGSLIIMALYHLFLYFMRRKEKSPLFFSLVCFVVCLRIITTGEKLFIHLFPDAPMELITSLEYISFFLSFPLFAMYFRSLYSEFSIIMLRITQISGIAFSLLVSFTSLRLYSYSLDYFYIIVLAAILYTFYVITAVMKAHREGAGIFLAGLIFFFGTVINDMLHGQQVIYTAFVTPYGLFVFIFSQSFLMSLRFSKAFVSNEHLTRELNILNRDLELKVSERTMELENSNRELFESREKISEAHGRLQELDRQKTDFFANISHELRTPLTLILSPVESVLQKKYRGDVDDEFFMSIRRNALRLLVLVSDLLDFSKIDAGKMKFSAGPIDIVKLFHSHRKIISSALEARGITLEVHEPSSPLIIYGDAEKIDTVIMNLFSNAMKFTEQGGQITIRIREDEGFARIDFSDTGKGIPPDQIETVFDRFSSGYSKGAGNPAGTGIGLSLSKEFIDLHGGTISVASRSITENSLEHGTTFHITLPIGTKHLENRDDVVIVKEIYSEAEENFSSEKYRGVIDNIDDPDKPGPETLIIDEGINKPGETSTAVLVVEDNSEMRKFLGNIFKDYFKVAFAVNGREGLSMARQLMPDIIISDVMMPEMDGYEMTAFIKGDPLLSKIPVILLTAKSDTEYIVYGLEHGADDYLAKPFNPEELLARMRSLLKLYEYQKLIVERNLVIENELETARLLLDRILPGRLPVFEEYRCHVAYHPMDKVGGDLYDITADANNVYLFIADVSGHGLPGAFLSTVIKMSLENLDREIGAAAALEKINSVICRLTVEGHFVTALYGILDRKTGILNYSNAGHFPCFVYRGSTGEFIDIYTRGLPFGWVPAGSYIENSLQLVRGDRLVMYTDGIIECMSPGKELFGIERLKEYIKQTGGSDPQQVTEGVFSRLNDFCHQDSSDDDICIIVFDLHL